VIVTALPLHAVYAPIPEQEQGKDLNFSVRAGVAYDSNIFGGATDAINSNVYTVAPRLTYNHSVTASTFVSADYGLTLDDIERRPGTKLLDSHQLMLRGAHAFSSSTNIDVTNTFMSSRNPESLLNGVLQNTDQSFWREQLDGRFVTPLSAKAGLEVKVRGVDTRFRNARLGRMLDRLENLYGVAGNYAVLPEVKVVGEARHLDVYYWKEGELKNKNSNYAMAGLDYDVAKKLSISSRLGAEWRHRALARNVTAPFAELSARYQYGERSFVTGGYGYTFDETSDPSRFTDQRVSRYFVNVQHAVTALIVASVSADYEPATLQGIAGQPDLRETTTRWGAALSYLPRKNWVVSLNYDLDRVLSQESSRSTERHRFGLSATCSF
jgi:hypothetical protein